MERLVAVGLGRGDIVFEAPPDRLWEMRVGHLEDAVAEHALPLPVQPERQLLGHCRLEDHPQAEQVVEGIQLDRLALHLSVRRVRGLRARLHPHPVRVLG